METYVRNELMFGTLRLPDRPRSRRKLARAACAACEAEGHLLTVEYAAQLSGLSLRQLFEQVEDGHLHYTERPGGPFVCLASLCAVTPQTRLGRQP